MDRDYMKHLRGVLREIRKTFGKEIAEKFLRDLMRDPVGKMQLRVLYLTQYSPKDYWRWYRFE